MLLLPDGNDYARSIIIADGYRGYFNSAWIGVSLSICYNVIIVFFGYYLIKDRGKVLTNNSINQVIGSTALEKSQFVASVFISKFLILLTTLIPVIITGLLAQLIKQESNDYNIIQLLLPFIVFTIPVLLVVTSLTCYFDTKPMLKGVLGNIAYFFIAYFSIAMELLRLPWSVIGINCMLNQICNDVAGILEIPFAGYTIFGGSYVKNKFLFEGLNYTFGLILGRLIVVVLSLLVIKAVTFNFKFITEEVSDEELIQQNSDYRNKLIDKIYNLASKLGLYEMMPHLSNIRTTQIYSLVVCMLLSFITQLRFFNVMLFLIPMNLLMKLLIFNKEETLLGIIKSTNYYPKQIVVSWFCALLVLIFANSPVVLRYLLINNYKAIVIVIAGCSIICSLAIFIIEFTNNENLFQILYMFLIYLLLDGNLYIVDFTGSSMSLWSNSLLLWYFLASSILILLLFTKRKLKQYYFFNKETN